MVRVPANMGLTPRSGMAQPLIEEFTKEALSSSAITRIV
jgi:hypothetical protein